VAGLTIPTPQEILRASNFVNKSANTTINIMFKVLFQRTLAFRQGIYSLDTGYVSIFSYICVQRQKSVLTQCIPNSVNVMSHFFRQICQQICQRLQTFVPIFAKIILFPIFPKSIIGQYPHERTINKRQK
jgi:hypothetical protein